MGRLARGIVLLIVRAILAVLTFGSFFIGFVTFGLGWVGAIIFGLILLILWIWQSFDAGGLAKQFNKAVEETGKNALVIQFPCSTGGCGFKYA